MLGKNVVRYLLLQYAGGYGYSRNWVEPSVDLYISRTHAAKNYAVTQYKLDPEKIIVRGHFHVREYTRRNCRLSKGIGSSPSVSDYAPIGKSSFLPLAE